MSLNELRALTASLALHLLPFLLLLVLAGGGQGDGDQKGKGNATDDSVNVEIIEMPEPVDVATVKKKEKGPGEDLPEEPEKKECSRHYEGIGVSINLFGKAGWEQVEEVPRGYPAYRAGLRKGDFVRNVHGGRIRGPKGTVVTLEVMRGNQTFFLDVTREEICYEKP